MIWLALPAVAAAPAEPPREVVAGDDIAAWTALGTEPDAEGLRAFIERFPDSPLAVRAWSDLVGTGQPDPEWRARHRRLVQRLERERVAGQARATATPTDTDVARLEPDGEPPPEPVDWTVHLHAGAALDGVGPAGAVGARVGRGPWSGVLRAQIGRAFLGEIDLRIAPPVFGAGFLELGLDTKPRGVARAGVRTALHGRVDLESSLGVAVGRDGLQPAVRLEIAWRAWPGPSTGSW